MISKLRVLQISESEFSVKGHGVHTAFVETSNALKRRADIDLAVNSRRPADIIHIHTIGTYALERLLFGKGKKVVSAHVVPDSLVGSLRGAHWWHGLATWYLRVFYNRADLVLAVSDETKEALQKIGVKRPIKVLYNMVDTSYYKNNSEKRKKLRKKYGFMTHDWVVIGNGQVQPRKRVDLFVKLAHELPDMKFVWVGGIPFKGAAAQYEKMKKLMRCAPDNLKFTGVVSLEEVRNYLHTGDTFVMLSDQETFGLAIVEAAAASLPVVLRDIPDYDHTFRDDSVICKPNEFKEALQKLRSDKKHYKNMVRSAVKLAKRYDSQTLCEELVGIYKDLLK